MVKVATTFITNVSNICIRSFDNLSFHILSCINEKEFHCQKMFRNAFYVEMWRGSRFQWRLLWLVFQQLRRVQRQMWLLFWIRSLACWILVILNNLRIHNEKVTCTWWAWSYWLKFNVQKLLMTSLNDPPESCWYLDMFSVINVTRKSRSSVIQR